MVIGGDHWEGSWWDSMMLCRLCFHALMTMPYLVGTVHLPTLFCSVYAPEFHFLSQPEMSEFFGGGWRHPFETFGSLFKDWNSILRKEYMIKCWDRTMWTFFSTAQKTFLRNQCVIDSCGINGFGTEKKVYLEVNSFVAVVLRWGAHDDLETVKKPAWQTKHLSDVWRVTTFRVSEVTSSKVWCVWKMFWWLWFIDFVNLCHIFMSWRHAELLSV